jgi:hypothetical protein
MDRDLLGTRRLAVVRDDYDRHQVRLCWGGGGVEGFLVAGEGVGFRLTCNTNTRHTKHTHAPTGRTACTWTASSRPSAAAAASCWRTSWCVT